MQKHAKVQELLTKVCDHVNLLERDYFGLVTLETPESKVGCILFFFFSRCFSRSARAKLGILRGTRTRLGAAFHFISSEFPQTWLESTKEIRKQVSGGLYEFAFGVKFYPPDPAQLTEDLTR